MRYETLKRFGIFIFVLFAVSFRSSYGHTLELSSQHDQTSNSINIAQRLTIVLPGNPTTGYLWEIESINEDMLSPDGAPAYIPDSSLIGAGGKFSFRFIAKKTGESSIKLVYRRPWEKDVLPLRTYQVSISVRDPSASVATASYISKNGDKLVASFDLVSKSVSVRLPGGTVVKLPAAVSASGARYSDGKNTFWEHQGTGKFYKGDELLFEGMAE